MRIDSKPFHFALYAFDGVPHIYFSQSGEHHQVTPTGLRPSLPEFSEIMHLRNDYSIMDMTTALLDEGEGDETPEQIATVRTNALAHESNPEVLTKRARRNELEPRLALLDYVCDSSSDYSG